MIFNTDRIQELCGMPVEKSAQRRRSLNENAPAGGRAERRLRQVIREEIRAYMRDMQEKSTHSPASGNRTNLSRRPHLDRHAQHARSHGPSLGFAGPGFM